jgi:hypothetical protein
MLYNFWEYDNFLKLSLGVLFYFGLNFMYACEKGRDLLFVEWKLNSYWDITGFY